MAGAADDDGAQAPQPWAPPGVAGGSLCTGVGAVCDTAVRLTGVDGAAVAVFAPSRSRELVYATDALAQQIDDLQFILGEGPCLDAYRAGSPRLCPQLDADPHLSRWPAFCGGAYESGARAVFAFPVLSLERPLGVLELYRYTVGELSSTQQDSAAVCAGAIAGTLASNWRNHLSGAIDAVAAIEAASSESDTPLTAGNRFSRAGVYVASGMVAVQLGVSADEGLDRLRAYTYAEGRSITEVAADIIAKRLSLGELRGAGGEDS
jgi:GAF domain